MTPSFFDLFSCEGQLIVGWNGERVYLYFAVWCGDSTRSICIE